MQKLKRSTITVIALMHIGTLAAFFFVNLTAIIAFGVLYVLSALGITLGYHRLLTHSSFRVPKIVKYFFLILGSLALQGGPISWAGLHSFHHRYVDDLGDPHSSQKGFWWSHIGWLLYKRDTGETKFMSILRKDLFIELLDKFFFVPSIILGIALYLMGGWSLLLWGGCARTVFVWHSTWLVNSACHNERFGYRTYDTPDKSRNVGWVAFLTLGEGYHNNHHRFPNFAYTGELDREVDITGLVIRLLFFLKLASE